MKQFRIVLVTVGVIAAAVALGTAASSWASTGTEWATLPGAPGSGGSAQAVLQPTHLEATYTAIAPCRIVATVHGGGKIAGGGTRTFFVGGTFGFTGQGGTSGGCGIPIGATAISATVTATDTSSHGYMRVWPAGLPEPGTVTLSYPQTAFSTSAGATISLATKTARSITVRNNGGSANLIIDVAGYYNQPLEALIDSGGAIVSGTSRIVSTTHPSVGAYTVTFDTNVRNCAVTASPYNVFHYATTGLSDSSTPNKVSVYLWQLDGTTHAETLADYEFFISVSC